jgi:hypothetical protein
LWMCCDASCKSSIRRHRRPNQRRRNGGLVFTLSRKKSRLPKPGKGRELIFMPATMETHIPPIDYFDRHYLADFEVFGSTAMCGFSMADALNAPKRPRFKGLTEFVVCQFELNLLNQAFYTHAAGFGWRGFSAPFADTHGCSMGHGMTNHIPHFIQTNNPAGFLQETFLKSIAGDYDCSACVLSPSGWETKNVTELIKT